MVTYFEQVNFMVLGGKFNSTKLKCPNITDDSYVLTQDLPGQKREANWWAVHSAMRRAEKIEWDMENSVNEKYIESEYSSTFNPDESHSLDTSLNHSQTGGFPIPLNPSFDLQALVWVSRKML